MATQEEWAAREERRRYMGARRNWWNNKEQRVAEIVRRCEGIITLLAPVAEKERLQPDQSGIVPASTLPELRSAYRLIDALRYLLPDIECWTVGRPSFDHRAVIWGCTSKPQAERLCAAANEVKAHHSAEWTVEFGPSPPDMVVKRSYSAEDLKAMEKGR